MVGLIGKAFSLCAFKKLDGLLYYAMQREKDGL